MENFITVFEAREYTTWFSWLYVIAIVLGVFAFFWLIQPLYQAIKRDGFRIFVKEKIFILLLVFAVVLSFASIALAYSGIETVVSGHSLYNRYTNGECDYVEGYISDFHPMPEDLHDSERFTVNGVAFSYGADNSEYYYSTCQKDGGVLKEGLYVRMWYFNADIGEEYPMSYIMRIEVLV